MSARSHDIDARNARTLRHIERASLQPPEFPVKPRRVFADMSEANQLSAIRDYLRTEPTDFGLIGEAINEHRFNNKFAEALFVADKEQAGKLAIQMVREYFARVVQSAWDRRDVE